MMKVYYRTNIIERIFISLIRILGFKLKPHASTGSSRLKNSGDVFDLVIMCEIEQVISNWYLRVAIGVNLA